MNTTIVTIAVMNADPFAREGIVHILNKQRNFKVIIEAYSGSDLLNQLERHTPLPHVVVLDTDTRLIEVHATIGTITRKYRTIKTVVLSSRNNAYSVCKIIEVGAKAYLIKNNNTACELVSAVQAVISGKLYYEQIDKTVLEKAKSRLDADLTDKEIQFLNLCCEGLSIKEIAEKMFVSMRTIEHYRASICKKFGISNQRKMVAFAFKAGIVSAI